MYNANTSGIQVVQPGQTKTRKPRDPNFPVAGTMEPQSFYPVMFSPVLPGETLDKVTYKSTVVSAPLASPLAGAWLETWSFFVRLTDIDITLAEMIIGQMTDATAFEAATDNPRYFQKAGQIKWCELCTERVHEAFFRDAEEPVRLADGVPVIKRINQDWMDSALKKVDVETVPTEGPESELTPQGMAFLAMRRMGQGVTSYDDYLKTYGVSKTITPERGEPELLSYKRYWTAPSNVINPADGSPSGAWYWRVDEKHEKPKRFVEPGFFIMFQAVRPKLYDGQQSSSYANSLWGFQDWIPSFSLEDPAAGIREFDPATQNIFTGYGDNTAGTNVVFDHRDLFTNGEQFINGAGRFDVPKSNGRILGTNAARQDVAHHYATAADITALYADPVTTRGIDYEGIVNMRVKGHVVDNT